MDYDNIIPLIGGFGRYQRRVYLIICFPVILVAFHIMGGVFLAAESDFRCLLPHESKENSTYEISPNLTNLAYPWDNKTNSWSRCERYDVDLTDQYYRFGGNLSTNTPTVKCDIFVYDKTTYKLTTVTEFNLVCDRSWLRTISDSLFMVGVMLGAIMAGGLSDKYGRSTTFYCCLVSNLVGGLLVAASPEIFSYTILRLIVGSSANGLWLIASVTALEMVSPEQRFIAGLGTDISFAIGYLLTTGFAYFITNWRTLQIAITIPSLICLVYWRLIPESVRWLLIKGRSEEAKGLILKAASENGAELSPHLLDSLSSYDLQTQSDLEQSSFFDLLRYPNLRRKTLLLCLNRFIVNCTYIGLSWSTSSLGGNDYLNFALSGLAEIPAITFMVLTLNKFGRKMILCCSLLLTSISLLSTTLVPADMPWLVILLAMVGKSAIASAFATSSVFTSEQFPTVIRSIGVGVCISCGEVGAIMAPIIISMSDISTSLPSVVFGSISLIAGLAALQLPETVHQKLPDTIQESENLGREK